MNRSLPSCQDDTIRIPGQYLSGFTAHMSHLGILVKCEFCFNEPAVMFPGEVDGSWILQSSQEVA